MLTVTPAYPRASGLVADYHPPDSTFTCNTSCSPTIHMTAPTQKPLLDTGASHCLLPYSSLAKHNIPHAKKIHLRVASGRPVRAMMHSEIIYASGVERGLVSVGQLRTILGLHFVWEDCHPVLLFPCVEHRCRYLLIQSRVDHNLPLISHEEMDMLLGAIQVAVEDGRNWTREDWESYLGVESLTPYRSFFDSSSTPSTITTRSALQPPASNSSLSVTHHDLTHDDLDVTTTKRVTTTQYFDMTIDDNNEEDDNEKDEGDRDRPIQSEDLYRDDAEGAS